MMTMHNVKSKILKHTLLPSFLLKWITAAGTMIMAKHMAEMIVSIGRILSSIGKINPTEPNISVTPIKRITNVGSPSTPVIPIDTNFFSEKTVLLIPE